MAIKFVNHIRFPRAFTENGPQGVAISPTEIAADGAADHVWN
jgi:hypothetical protein